MGVWAGVWLKGMYLWALSRPPGLLREWLCRVLWREGGCVCEYCEALVCMGCCWDCDCMVGSVVGDEYAVEMEGRDPPAGCSAPGRPSAAEAEEVEVEVEGEEEAALEGITLETWDP